MTEVKKRVNGRTKGNSYERKMAQLFRDLGFKCTTSRFSSKEKDDAKVDLCGTDPLNIQLKAVEKTMCLHTVLESMPNDENINLVFHKKNRREPLVAMHQKDFLKILSWLIDSGHVKNHLTK